MRSWTVHAPPAAGSRPGQPAAPAILVPEGFSWGACLLTLPWLLWHRLWLAAVIYAAAGLALAALLPPAAILPVGLAAQFLLGAHGQDLRRAALARRGWRLAHVVAAPDADRALARVVEAAPDLAPGLIRAALA
jgi:hypothetical protein